MLIALEIPLSFLFWTIGAWATAHILPIFGRPHCRRRLEQSNPGAEHPFCGDWPSTVRKVCLAGIVVAAVFLAEKFVVQLISIHYHRKQYDAKIKESKRMIRLLDLLYEASRTLFPEFCREFQEEDQDIQGNNLTELRKSISHSGVGTKVFNDMGRVSLNEP